MEEQKQKTNAVTETIGSIERIAEAVNTLSGEAMTQKQVAARLGVSKATVNAWIRRGQVLTATAGSIPFIPMQEVNRMVKVIAGEQKHQKVAR